MCGRFVAPGEAEIEAFWHIGRNNWRSPYARVRQARFNVAPQQGNPQNHVPVIRADADGVLELTDMQWWLLPYWSKEARIKYSTFNARIETVASSASFREPFKRRRCLIPARGWYEWQDLPGGKQPWFFHAADNSLLAFAGLWDRWQGEAQAIESCSIIVGEPDAAVASHLRALVVAARRHHRVEIDYSAASRAQAERRPIDPYGIVHHAGEWYVVGHCHKRGDVRTFRIDRIAALHTTGETFERPVEFDLEAYRRDRLYVPSADSVTVRVQLDALAVTRIGANWPIGEVTVQDDGSAELLVDCDGFEGIIGWGLGLGSHAWIVEPAAARRAMRERIARLRAELSSGGSVKAPSA